MSVMEKMIQFVAACDLEHRTFGFDNRGDTVQLHEQIREWEGSGVSKR